MSISTTHPASTTTTSEERRRARARGLTQLAPQYVGDRALRASRPVRLELADGRIAAGLDERRDDLFDDAGPILDLPGHWATAVAVHADEESSELPVADPIEWSDLALAVIGAELADGWALVEPLADEQDQAPLDGCVIPSAEPAAGAPISDRMDRLMARVEPDVALVTERVDDERIRHAQGSFDDRLRYLPL